MRADNGHKCASFSTNPFGVAEKPVSIEAVFQAKQFSDKKNFTRIFFTAPTEPSAPFRTVNAFAATSELIREQSIPTYSPTTQIIDLTRFVLKKKYYKFFC